jgi:polyribonucleotide nucleotidyltransferase
MLRSNLPKIRNRLTFAARAFLSARTTRPLCTASISESVDNVSRMGDPPGTLPISTEVTSTLRLLDISPGGLPDPLLSPSIPAMISQRIGRVSTMLGGRELSLEVGKIGPLADAVVYARFGATSVLVSAVSSWTPSTAGGFLPLQVDYIEKAFAAGQIPTTFTRRESSSSDRELLAARAIDRSLRPLFDKGYFYDTQIICSVMSFDKDCDPGMLAILAASAALHVSNIPFNGPVAAVRVGLLAKGPGGSADANKPMLAPLAEEDALSALDLLYSATEDRALMMELAGDEVPEAALIRCLRFAHDAVQV